MKAMAAQGFVLDENGIFQVPEDRLLSLQIPSSLIPVCPDDGGPVSMNLRADDTFVEDEGWHAAAERYAGYLQSHEGKHVLFLELGVGGNTPVFYALNPIRPKMAKNNRFYPGNGYFMKELSRITDSERLWRCA